MSQIDHNNIKAIKDKIEELREQLNDLTACNNNFSSSEEIISLSQDLDKFICDYHKSNEKKS